MAARRYWLLLALETANLVVEPSKLQMSCTSSRAPSLSSTPLAPYLSSPSAKHRPPSATRSAPSLSVQGEAQALLSRKEAKKRILSFSKYISKELSLAAGWHEKEVSIFLLAFHAIHRVSLYSLSHYCERGLTLIPRVTFIR